MTDECCDRCRYAKTPESECDCRCGGRFHGGGNDSGQAELFEMTDEERDQKIQVLEFELEASERHERMYRTLFQRLSIENTELRAQLWLAERGVTGIKKSVAVTAAISLGMTIADVEDPFHEEVEKGET